jgi:hypothetical protein
MGFEIGLKGKVSKLLARIISLRRTRSNEQFEGDLMYFLAA